MSAKSRRKGAVGEREFLSFLEGHLPSICFQRNYDQAAFGGSDLIGLPNISLEIKRYKVGNVHRREWWQQSCDNAEKESLIPMLAYRFDRSDWQTVVPLQWMANEIVDNPRDMIACMPASYWIEEVKKRL